MDRPFIKKIIKDTGRTYEELDPLWQKAKKIIIEKFSVKENDFELDHYSEISGIVYQILDIKEHGDDPSYFLKSSLPIDQYLEMMTSSAFAGVLDGDISNSDELKSEDSDDIKDEEFKMKTGSSNKKEEEEEEGEEEKENDDDDEEFKIVVKKENTEAGGYSVAASQFGIDLKSLKQETSDLSFSNKENSIPGTEFTSEGVDLSIFNK